MGWASKDGNFFFFFFCSLLVSNVVPNNFGPPGTASEISKQRFHLAENESPPPPKKEEERQCQATFRILWKQPFSNRSSGRNFASQSLTCLEQQGFGVTLNGGVQRCTPIDWWDNAGVSARGLRCACHGGARDPLHPAFTPF